jgi:hypothetical protein
MALLLSEMISMKFIRKLIKRDGQYGSITIPPEVLCAWNAVDHVEMTFDGTSLYITPLEGGHCDHL